MNYVVEVFDGRLHPSLVPYRSEQASSEREARRIAASLLGRRTLRGAATWERYQGGTVFQFGPRTRTESNDHDYVVIEVKGRPIGRRKGGEGWLKSYDLRTGKRRRAGVTPEM